MHLPPTPPHDQPPRRLEDFSYWMGSPDQPRENRQQPMRQQPMQQLPRPGHAARGQGHTGLLQAFLAEQKESGGARLDSHQAVLLLTPPALGTPGTGAMSALLGPVATFAVAANRGGSAIDAPMVLPSTSVALGSVCTTADRAGGQPRTPTDQKQPPDNKQTCFLPASVTSTANNNSLSLASPLPLFTLVTTAFIPPASTPSTSSASFCLDQQQHRPTATVAAPRYTQQRRDSGQTHSSYIGSYKSPGVYGIGRTRNSTPSTSGSFNPLFPALSASITDSSFCLDSVAPMSTSTTHPTTSGVSLSSHSQQQQQQQQQQLSLRQTEFHTTASTTNITTAKTIQAAAAAPNASMTTAAAAASSSIPPPQQPSMTASTTTAAAGRVNQACASCRRKKVRCDGVQPSCGNCISRGMACTYLAQKKRGRPPKSQQHRQTAMPYYPPSVSSSTQASSAGSAMAAVVTNIGFSQTPPRTTTAFSVGQAQQQHAFSVANSMASAPAYFSQWPTSGAMPTSGIPHSSSGNGAAATGSMTHSSAAAAAAVDTQLSRVPTSSSTAFFQSQQSQQQQTSHAYSGDHSMGLFAAARGDSLHQQQGPLPQSTAFHLTTSAIDVGTIQTPVTSTMQISPTADHNSQQQQQLSSPMVPALTHRSSHPAFQFHQHATSTTPTSAANNNGGGENSQTGAASSLNNGCVAFGNGASRYSQSQGHQPHHALNKHGQANQPPDESSMPVSAQLPLQGSRIGLHQQQQQQLNPSSLLDIEAMNTQQGILSGYLGSATTDVHGSDYFGTFPAPRDAPPRNSIDDVDIQSLSFSFPPNLQALDGAAGAAVSGAGHRAGGVYATSAAAALAGADLSTPGAGEIDHRVQLMTSIRPPVQFSAQGDTIGFGGGGTSSFLPLTAPPPMPPLLQPQAMGHTALPHAAPELPAVSSRRPHAMEKDALSFTLGNVAVAMSKKGVDSDCVQSTLDHLSYVTKNISSASQDALVQAKEAAAEAAATIDAGAAANRQQADQKPTCTPIHDTLLRMERRVEHAEKAVHNYFCFIHHQCPIIHKPSFLNQIRDGTVSHFVWFSLRALSARTLLHSHALSEAEVLIEEEYFAAKAHVALSAELNRPSVEVVQGLALLSLYVFGTPRWQEASMYWCKATRLAQLMEYHAIDAPTRAIATKLHFGIFEPPKKGTTHRDDLALIPGDFSGDHVPLAQALTPLEAELRRRLWWTLFTNERFCSIAERLPTMVNEARMFVHFPCTAKEWDQPEFTYQAPERVPRYLREGYSRAQPGDDLNRLTLGQEMSVRKSDNLYLMSEIEYGFSMSHLVAFLADMSLLFRPRSPYGNDYIPMFMQMTWPNKMKTLRANVERVERIFEMVRQDILQRLAIPSNTGTSQWTPVSRPSVAATGGSGRRTSNGVEASFNDPVLDCETYAPGIEIPHLHQLSMLILYSVLNIHLYRMVFQIHYELSSSLPEPAKRENEDNELLAAFDQYVKDLWLRTTTAAQQVSRILRGEYPGVPQWVLTLAGIRKSNPLKVPTATQSPVTGPDPLLRARNEGTPEALATNPESSGMMDVDSDPTQPPPQEGARQSHMQRLKDVFQEKIRAQEAHLHEVANSVFASFRRTLPYALLLAAKVHIDNIEWWANENQADKMARAYLDLAEIVHFLETHQLAFSSTDYVSLVKGMMRVDITQ